MFNRFKTIKQIENMNKKQKTIIEPGRSEKKPTRTFKKYKKLNSKLNTQVKQHIKYK